MAEFFPSILVPGIIEHLNAWTAKKLGLLWSCVEDFEKLKNIIVLELQPVLLDAEEKQAGDLEISGLLRMLTDILYEVDGLLDDLSNKALWKELMTRNMKAKQVCIFFSKSNQLVFNRRMGLKIKTVLNDLDHIANDLRKFHFERHGKIPVEEINWERDNNAFCPEELLIGRDEDKKAVVELLMDSNVEDKVSILPIVGIRGMGKTTLAQFAFNHEKIQKYFLLKMWVHVCVSHDEVDMEKAIVRKILESARNKKVPFYVKMDLLLDDIRKEIYGKKYLLVLDNLRIMDPESWFDLRRVLHYLQDGARGSKILVTTRSEELVADITTMCTVKPYYLRGLDERHSWYLFKRMAFKNGQEPNNKGIVNIGIKEIVRKCEGVPLIIRTIGRLSYFKNSETKLLPFVNNELSRIRLNEEASIATLKLIYDQLPGHLKLCFAYTSLFPKNYEIDKSTLINLWIAQGFIKPSNEDECLEDAGHEYFVDLISRFFFEKVTTDWSGEVTSFKMNDLMYDLAIFIAVRLKMGTRHIWGTPHRGTRHFNIPFNPLRTLILSASDSICEPWGMTEFECDAFISSFKTLRALKFQGRDTVILPSSSFWKLNSLRYLDLSGMYSMKKLPDSITSLQNLQTLKLCNCHWLEEWPRDFSRLFNLRLLDINGCWKLTYMPRGLGQLTKLRSLSDFLVSPLDSDLNMHSAGLNELNGLNYLRGDLQIRNLGCGKDDAKDYKAANLKAKQKIRSLKLYWDDSFGLRDDADAEIKLKGFKPPPNLRRLELIGYKGAEFPSWLSSLSNLVEFQLSKCEKLKHLPPLSKLPSLKRLFLKYLDDIEYIMDDSEYIMSDRDYTIFGHGLKIFPSLEELQVYYCPNLKGWWRKEPLLASLFPCLSELSVAGCTVLDSMPMFPHLEKELVLSNASWKPMQQTLMNMSIFASSSFVPLSKLKRLRLRRIEDLQILPEKGLQNLTSLVSLQIFHCHRLKSLSQGIQYLTGLQELEINHCDKLDLGCHDEAGMGWQGLKSLLSLDFVGLPKLVHLPLGLQHVTTLHKFQISSCCMLRALPVWICKWTSLQQFEISNCPSLISLPKEMRLLKSLKVLTIRKQCPKLLPGASPRRERIGPRLNTSINWTWIGPPSCRKK
ncbi:putative disease resistance protein RGA4 [Carya illinoinensis]|uniref:Uncharacterized protein n=2 Tax=Carya illinoinensis TaxID=32201 RepID=A0A8T1NJI5_CARIL|nr:putative disease resistance protein RGA4 [Carya illinoinensis]KAG6628970.1 hypothetical protein CIPAW_14G050200 [Carya illinoinensis]KAG6677921.1 hypothetical protein I3842_14G052700 [Carya illinoinensis]KAG6677924.1 hypothetical protein I3842_14G052700 [Carya illinoinensis]